MDIIRNKLGQFTKLSKPTHPFPKGNKPWNWVEKIDFTCLFCGLTKKVKFSQRKKKFCSKSCKGKFYGQQMTKHLPRKTDNFLCKGREREYKADWYQTNKERLSLRYKIYYQKNKEKINATCKIWNSKNKTKVRFVKQQYKRRKRNAIGNFSFKEWEALKKHYCYTCLQCKRQEPIIKLEADHIIPLSRGGTNEITNIQPLCRSCNASKGNRIKVKI